MPIKNALKNTTYGIFRYVMGMIDQNPELRQKIIGVLRKTGVLAKVKKAYFNRLSEDENPYSHLMIGPVIAVDITPNQLSQHAQKIYSDLANRPIKMQKEV